MGEWPSYTIQTITRDCAASVEAGSWANLSNQAVDGQFVFCDFLQPIYLFGRKMVSSLPALKTLVRRALWDRKFLPSACFLRAMV